MESSNSSHRSRNRNYSPFAFHDNSNNATDCQNNHHYNLSKRKRYDEHTYYDNDNVYSPESGSYYR